MRDFFSWLITSSADPDNTSLAVKGLLLGSVTYVLQVSTLVCGLGLLCLGLDADWLTSAINGLTTILTGVLYLVSGAMAVWGLIRKFRLGRWAAVQK
jgi:hypothetical protein